MSDTSSTITEAVFITAISLSFIISIIYLRMVNDMADMGTSRSIFLLYLIIIAVLLTTYYTLYKVFNFDKVAYFNTGVIGVGCVFAVITFGSFFIAKKVNASVLNTNRSSY